MLEEFEKLSNDILTKACENIDNIRTVAVESIDKQNQIIAKTVEGITNTNLVIEKLIKDLGGYRLLENLETIIHKLDRQEKVSKTNKLLLTILIIIFGFEFVFIIAKDYGIFNF